MRLGVIDIGSNTVRLAVYETDTLKIIKNGVNYAGLIAYVDKGKISKDGIEILCTAINEMTEICRKCDCEGVYAFATASLRDITDKKTLAEIVRERTGVMPEFISGKREAELDYLGLKLSFNVKDGAVFDLGGGSAQLITFKNEKVLEYTSKKIGALKIYKSFVSKTFPNEEETENIREYVRAQLDGFSGEGYPYVFAMGGAASALKKLCKSVFEKTDDEFSLSDLSVFYALPESIIKAVVPERLYTIKPALLAIEEICKALGTEKIRVVSCGVRDGAVSEFMRTNRLDKTNG